MTTVVLHNFLRRNVTISKLEINYNYICRIHHLKLSVVLLSGVLTNYREHLLCQILQLVAGFSRSFRSLFILIPSPFVRRGILISSLFHKIPFLLKGSRHLAYCLLKKAFFWRSMAGSSPDRISRAVFRPAISASRRALRSA